MGHDRKRLTPGELVLGLDETSQLRMKSGVIISVQYESDRQQHHGCERRLLVLWTGKIPSLVEECDCGIIVPVELGL